jgi:hypothetical protein
MAFYLESYHGVNSSFFGIGILPVSDLTGWSVFRSILLVWRELLFSAKGGLAVSKRGPVPPFSLKKGARAPYLREKGVPAKKMIPKCTDQDFLWYRYGKYQEKLTNTDRKIPIRYLLIAWGLLTELSKRIRPESCFFLSIISQFLCIVHTYFVPGGVAIYR